MIDSPPPYSLPPDEPLPPMWTQILKPLGRLGVRIAEIIAGDITVPVEDLRPNPTYAEITSAAVNDIRLCQMLFDEWMTEMDKVSSKKPDDRERVLKLYLGSLKEDASWCSHAINKILENHVRFASLMARRIDNASKSQNNLKYDDSETTTIAIKIKTASRSLMIFVSRIEGNLKSFVSALEEVQVAVKEQSLAEKFLGWLKYLLKAIVSVVAAVCSPISSLLSRIEPNPQYLASGVSTLRKAAAEFCRADPENGAANLDSVILYLKRVVPKEVRNARQQLKEFNEALLIMGLESHMRAGGRVTLYGPDLAAVAEEWRDLAKQYQSMLPDDEDPAF